MGASNKMNNILSADLSMNNRVAEVAAEVEKRTMAAGEKNMAEECIL